MGKKQIPIDSKFQLKKCAKRRHGDWISRLPDEILVAILCLLPFKDALKTSILSSRWTNLWKHHPSLDFDIGDDALCRIVKQNERREQKRCEYANWVSCILQTHKAPTVRDFKIRFDLEKPHHETITQWLEFAFAKKVQRLALDLSVYGFYPLCWNQGYAFPEELLFGSGPSAFQHNMLVDIKFLKLLSLKSVNVSDEAVEFFLRNCPLLEELAVHGSYKLSTLQVCGASLVLKHLKMRNNFQLKSMKVSAPHLTSLQFTVNRGKPEILLENVPMLVELSIECSTYENGLLSISRCISQLQVLNLVLANPMENFEVRNFPQFPKLRKLVITYYVGHDKSLIGVVSLIRASPHLEEFVLNLASVDPSWSDRQVKKTIKFVHQHLKVIKLCGYYDRTSDEFVKCILDNTVALEKITIDPRDITDPDVPIDPLDLPENELNDEETGRKFAKQQLEGKLPQHVELLII